MRAMKDSGIAWIGEIPADWSITILSALFYERKCKNRGLVEKNLLSLSYGNIVRKSIESNEGLLPASFETYNIVESGNIVFRLTDLQNDKRSLRTGLCKERGIITSAYVTLQIRSDDSPRYMHYLFHTYDLCKVFYGLGDGVRQGMNYEDLKHLQVLRPDLKTQHRIADYLDRKCSQIDAIIARQQEVIEKLKAYKLSVITEAVTKGLNPHAPMKDSGVEWIGEIPEQWEVRKAAFICDRLVVGVVIKPAEYFDDKGTIPFLRGINLKEYSINTDNLVYITDETNKMLSKSIVRSGDILIVRDGNIGVACVVPPFLDGANVVSMIIMTPIKRYNSCYICYFINSSIGKLQFELTKIGSALTHTSVSAVSKLQLAIPPEEEQNKIVEFLDEKCSSIEMFISKKQVIVDNLIAYKKSLIYEVVTGKKEV